MYGQYSYEASYEQIELIGKGSFGKVYKVYSRIDKSIWAAKKIQLQGLSEDQFKNAAKQIEIHQTLSHSNIIQFHQYFYTGNQLIIIMEYCEFGDLGFYIKKRCDLIAQDPLENQPFSEEFVMNIFIQILFGLNYLHENKIIHRDIKTSNIFINSEGRIKLADFGIAKVIDSTMKTFTSAMGTPRYLSPQVCSNLQPTFKSDIWAVGCVLYELCSLKPAFDGNNVLALGMMIANNQVPNIDSNRYSENLNALIHWVLEKQPEKRPYVHEILQLRFISEYKKKFSGNSPSKKKQTPMFEKKNNYVEENTQNYELQKIKQKCIRVLGGQKYAQMYSYIRHLKETIKKKDKIDLTLQKYYGQNQYELAQCIYNIIDCQKEQQF